MEPKKQLAKFAVLWPLGRLLGDSWTNFGAQKVRWDLLLFSPWSKEAAHGRLGTVLWPSWYHLVAILGHFQVILGPSWSIWGLSWCILGHLWTALGMFWDRLDIS